MRRIQRRFVTLLTALVFTVVSVSGVIAYFSPFYLQLVGLHALMGFVFIGVVYFHVRNNFRSLMTFAKSRVIWVCLFIAVVLSVGIWQQWGPVPSLLGLSKNLGPTMTSLSESDEGLTLHYAPSETYQMELKLRAGTAYDLDDAPHLAVWLENQGGYHIKTLHGPDAIDDVHLPYWSFKRAGWQKAKAEAEAGGVQSEEEVDGVSKATPNGSFDPRDYILPVAGEEASRYKLLVELNQPGDAHGEYSDQPSLVYSVIIDNALPVVYQVLELEGYPKQEDEDAKEAWALYYVDEGFGSALSLLDSALLRIERNFD